MSIKFFEEQVKKPHLKYRIVANWLKKIISNNNRYTGDVTYIFCNDAYLLEINKQFLQHDFFTDIITFDYVENNKISGDIFVSCEMVEENARKFGVNLEDEFLRVIVHGILHLLGYKDKTEEESLVMRKKESEYIEFYREIEHGTGEL